MKLPATGGCLCGAVRYTISVEPIRVRQCWCRTCQYLGAGSSTVNVLLPRDGVSFTGALTRYESVADSGNRLARGFCATCGTPVSSGPADPAVPFIIVRAGTLDDPSEVKPSVDIWTASAPEWVCFDPALTKFTHQPPPG